MQIGDFAKICGTTITVLRHYDKTGVLVPEYTDKFTGYRHYSADQAAVFRKITALKKAGFALSEIRSILSDTSDDSGIFELFNKRKNELHETLGNIEEAKKVMLTNIDYSSITNITPADGITYARANLSGGSYDEIKRAMDCDIRVEHYQRISGFRRYGDDVVCDVIKLSDKTRDRKDDIPPIFEDDGRVVGKWEIIGEYAVCDDFYADTEKSADYDSWQKNIYFLPNGERYWCYRWTRGYLITEYGDCGPFLNEYRIDTIDGQTYMFISYKSYEYRHGGMPVTLVLKQIDSKAYTKDEIGRKDDIGMEFANDERVLGKWNVYAFCRDINDKDNFNPDDPSLRRNNLHFTEVEFSDGGHMRGIYGGRTVENEDVEVWTRGYILRKFDSTACAYEIREVGGREYLIIEWKSGDYVRGGFDPNYYIFTRS